MCQIMFKGLVSNGWYFLQNYEKTIAELWTVVFNQIIKYQLTHARFDNNSDHKHDTHVYEKLSSNLISLSS